MCCQHLPKRSVRTDSMHGEPTDSGLRVSSGLTRIPPPGSLACEHLLRCSVLELQRALRRIEVSGLGLLAKIFLGVRPITVGGQE